MPLNQSPEIQCIDTHLTVSFFFFSPQHQLTQQQKYLQQVNQERDQLKADLVTAGQTVAARNSHIQQIERELSRLRQGTPAAEGLAKDRFPSVDVLSSVCGIIDESVKTSVVSFLLPSNVVAKQTTGQTPVVSGGSALPRVVDSPVQPFAGQQQVIPSQQLVTPTHQEVIPTHQEVVPSQGTTSFEAELHSGAVVGTPAENIVGEDAGNLQTPSVAQASSITVSVSKYTQRRL